MKVFVFDTETTGFINKNAPLEQQPYIVQFGGIMAEMGADGAYEEIERVNELVKPPIAIPFGSSQVHNIYDKDVADKADVSAQIDHFLKYLNGADVVVGHNLEYDTDVVNCELERMNRKGDYNPQSECCTMKSAVDFCAIPGRGFNFKYPKLNELYKKIFGEYFEGAHDAMFDVEATLKCLSTLVKEGVITFEVNNELRLF